MPVINAHMTEWFRVRNDICTTVELFFHFYIVTRLQAIHNDEMAFVPCELAAFR
jgi:hypothetical protein